MTVDETQAREAVQPASPAPGSAPSTVEQDPQLPAPTTTDDAQTHAAVGLAALAGSVDATSTQATVPDAAVDATPETSDEEAHAPVGLAALAATGEDPPAQAPVAPADADTAPTLTMPAVASANGAAPSAEGTPPVAVEPAAPAAPVTAPVEQPSPAAEPTAVAAGRTHQKGRPHTVPSVNLSWREADSLDLGVPTVDDNEGAIVLEPPSQLVADTRRRSGHRHHMEDLGPEDGDVPLEGTPADPSDVAADADANDSPSTRAASRAAARDAAARKVRQRRIVVIVAVVLVLAVIGWLVLRGDGSGTAGPEGSGSSTIALLSAAQATPAGD